MFVSFITSKAEQSSTGQLVLNKTLFIACSRNVRSKERSNESKEVMGEADHKLQSVQSIKVNKSVAPPGADKSPAAVNTKSRQSEHVKSPSVCSDSVSTLPTTPKQFVLRLPSASSEKTCKSEDVETVKDKSEEVLASKLCFVCSGLPMGLIGRVKALARMLGAEFSNKFEPQTTHLVVKASDNMMADKTYKYLSAVVRRKWIVSMSWVNACLQARTLLPEVIQLFSYDEYLTINNTHNCLLLYLSLCSPLEGQVLDSSLHLESWSHKFIP